MHSGLATVYMAPFEDLQLPHYLLSTLLCVDGYPDKERWKKKERRERGGESEINKCLSHTLLSFYITS